MVLALLWMLTLPFISRCTRLIGRYLVLTFSFHVLLAGHVQTIDSFVSESLEILSNRPESMEEISEANSKYNQILAQKLDVS